MHKRNIEFLSNNFEQESKPGTGKTRKKKRAVRIKEIQTAAKKLFFEKGFYNTTMDEVAQTADISKGTVYLYFKNKDELYISLMMPVLIELGRFLENFEKKYDSGKLKNKKSFIQELYKVHKKTYDYDPEGIQIIQAFQQGNIFMDLPSETLDKLNQRAIRNYNMLRRCFKNAIKDGLFKSRNPIIMADTVWALFIGIIQLEESKFRATNKNHIENTLRVAFEMLNEGL